MYNRTRHKEDALGPLRIKIKFMLINMLLLTTGILFTNTHLTQSMTLSQLDHHRALHDTGSCMLRI